MDAIYTKVAEFMTDTVTFTAKASVDKYNKPTFSGDTTVTVVLSMTQLNLKMFKELKLLILDDSSLMVQQHQSRLLIGWSSGRTPLPSMA